MGCECATCIVEPGERAPNSGGHDRQVQEGATAYDCHVVPLLKADCFGFLVVFALHEKMDTEEPPQSRRLL